MSAIPIVTGPDAARSRPWSKNICPMMRLCANWDSSFITRTSPGTRSPGAFPLSPWLRSTSSLLATARTGRFSPSAMDSGNRAPRHCAGFPLGGCERLRNAGPERVPVRCPVCVAPGAARLVRLGSVFGVRLGKLLGPSAARAPRDPPPTLLPGYLALSRLIRLLSCPRRAAQSSGREPGSRPQWLPVVHRPEPCMSAVARDCRG